MEMGRGEGEMGCDVRGCMEMGRGEGEMGCDLRGWRWGAVGVRWDAI